VIPQTKTSDVPDTGEGSTKLVVTKIDPITATTPSGPNVEYAVYEYIYITFNERIDSTTLGNITVAGITPPPTPALMTANPKVVQIGPNLSSSGLVTITIGSGLESETGVTFDNTDNYYFTATP
jgi:hypothetical protein